MNRAAAALLAFGAMVAGVFASRSRAAAMPAAASPAVADAWAEAPGAAQESAADYPVQDLGTWESSAGIAPASLPAMDGGREARNVAAFLRALRFAEGTAGEGGYGALFGWPRIAGRSFDPYTIGGHPRQFFDYTDKAGRRLRTSAAGAYQITYTTWATYWVAFVAWCSVNGYSSNGFLPETQDAFAVFLLYRDGALDHVRAGRLADAIAIARGRWASLPGAGYDQPERAFASVARAYTSAGGTIA